MTIGVDSADTTIHLGNMTASEAKKIMLSQPTGTWFIHNNKVDLLLTCKWCGDENCPNYIEGACWKCWRNRHPGALS